MERAEALLREATVEDGMLHRDDEPLTSEFVKQEIEIELLRRDCALAETIVACGADAADPHDRGSGPLEADETIVIDIFADGDGTACGVGGAIERRLEVNVPLDSIEWDLGVAEPLRFNFIDDDLDIQIDVRGLAR